MQAPIRESRPIRELSSCLPSVVNVATNEHFPWLVWRDVEISTTKQLTGNRRYRTNINAAVAHSQDFTTYYCRYNEHEHVNSVVAVTFRSSPVSNLNDLLQPHALFLNVFISISTPACWISCPLRGLLCAWVLSISPRYMQSLIELSPTTERRNLAIS